MATTKAKTRGSQKLNASRKEAAGLSQSALAKRLRGLGTGALSNDVIINGTPRIDSFAGTVTVKDATAVGNVLSKLLNIPGAQLKPVQLFPKGQPPAIDQIVIKINGKMK
jgi:hypothetical protein